MLRVAVIGGGPSGSCAAEILAKAGIETWLFERKLDNAKPCGGAIPLCMVEEFDLPDGDFLELAWMPSSCRARENVRLLVILHGLEGSWQSP